MANPFGRTGNDAIFAAGLDIRVLSRVYTLGFSGSGSGPGHVQSNRTVVQILEKMGGITTDSA
jgi:hypothetical protein